MAECEKCGKESMGFTCKYCGGKYCSEHRLPENHECDSMEEEIEKEKEEADKWFQEKTVRNRPPEPQKPSMFGDILETFSSNATLSIITLTVFFFILQGFPGVTEALLLDPRIESLIRSPWTLLTIMLVHAGPFHIFANMVTFYFFGTPLEKIIGSRELLKFYIFSGLVAAVAMIGFGHLLHFLHGVPLRGGVGASGAVVAVFGAVAMLYPDAEVLLYFFIPMKIRTALGLFAGLEILNMSAKLANIYLPVLGNFSSSAHLAGLAVGVYYGYRLRQRIQTQKVGVLDLMDF